MRSFTDARFALTFNRLVSAAHLQGDNDYWTVNGVAIARERHNCRGPEYGFSVEVFRLRAARKPVWDMIVVRQHWWGPRHQPIRSSHWAKLLAGSKTAALAWFCAFENAPEEAVSPGLRVAARR